MTRFKGYGDGILGGIQDGIQDQDAGIHGQGDGIRDGIQDQEDGIRDGILHQDDAQDVHGDGKQSAGDAQGVHGDGIGDQYAHNAQDAQDDDVEGV